MAVERALATVEPAPASLMITPAGTIQQALEQFRLYQELKEKLATEDDFQPIAGKKHPKKSFVRKVQRFFNLSCELLRDEPLRDGEGNIVAWLATARATHLPTGAYQDADGSCSFDEKVERQKTIHNIRAHAITRAKNRAILDLVGFGEVSAEEIGEAEHQQANGRTSHKSSNEPASEKQLKAIYAIVKELGWDSDDARAALNARYGITSSKDLTKTQASDFIEYLKAQQAEANEEPVPEEPTDADS